MPSDAPRVLVAAGGPVGLFAALQLGRAGLAVRIFEEHATLQEDPRAATTHPGTLEILGEPALVAELVRREIPYYSVTAARSRLRPWRR